MFYKRILFTALVVLSIAVLVLLNAAHPGILFLAKLTIALSLSIPVLLFVLDKTVGMEYSKALAANFLLFASTITVCLLIAEVAVRQLFDQVTTTSDNTSYFSLRWKAQAPPRINALGFREREISKQKPEGVRRIAVVGDSFTYGQGIAEDERFANIIERHLNENGDRYEVLNFGKPGAETIDHTGFLDAVFELEPDFILLQWLPNDVEGHDKSRRPQPYRLIPSDYLSGLLHRHSALFYLVNAKFGKLQTATGLIESYEASMLARFGDPASEDSRRADGELDQFIRRVKDQGVPLGIVMFPYLAEAGGSVESYPYGFLFDRVINACHRHAIRCLDLRPVFASVSPASRLWANRLDSHPGPLANEMAAEALVEAFGGSW
jgi:GDSL-like Lipase/Acylhydrolase family